MSLLPPSLGSTTTHIQRASYTDTKKAALIKQWQDSKLTKAEFCRRMNLKASLFYGWTSPSKEKLHKKEASGMQFSQIKNTTHAVPRATFEGRPNLENRQLVIDTKGGIKITLPLPTNPQALYQLIKALLCN